MRPDIRVREHEISGVQGRLIEDGTSYLQAWSSKPRPVHWYGQCAKMHLWMRFDDIHDGGHQRFRISAYISTEETRRDRDFVTISVTPDQLASTYPELAPLVSWNMCGTDGPINYIENTLRHASDRDQEGRPKDRDLDAARASGMWPDATDAELMVAPEQLRRTLEARLGKLLGEFRSVMESLGFEWKPEPEQTPEPRF